MASERQSRVQVRKGGKKKKKGGGETVICLASLYPSFSVWNWLTRCSEARRKSRGEGGKGKRGQLYSGLFPEQRPKRRDTKKGRKGELPATGIILLSLFARPLFQSKRTKKGEEEGDARPLPFPAANNLCV